MTEPTPIIHTQALTRNFKKVCAVDSLDLTVQTGEIYGLVGPDGAGKTTTLRLLAALLEISKGSATVAGYDLSKDPEGARPKIGYMAQQFSLYSELTVRENLVFFADLYSVSRQDRLKRTARLLEFAQLSDLQDRRAEHLSGGMQKKLALATTLIHEPDLLLLDEPTTGVDPVSRREFWDLLTELHLGGTTIVVSTPYLDEAERCHRVGLMYEGRLVLDDTPKNIEKLVQGEMVELRPSDWREARQTLDSMPGVLEVQTYGGLLRVFVDSAEQRIPEISARMEELDIDFGDLRQASPHLEEAFVSLIRGMEN